MKIAFFTKRQYTGKDLLDDRYGRLYEIPIFMSEMGNSLLGFCISYRKKQQGLIIQENNMTWYSINSHYMFNGIYGVLTAVIPLIKKFKPEVIVGCSDSFNIILAYWIARLLKVSYVVDLYDNFESFPETHFPGIRYLFRNAVINADAIICVSQPLAEFVTENYTPKSDVFLIENAINRDNFFVIDKAIVRKKLALPPQAILIGTLGALDNSRNINVLYKAFEKISSENKNIHLVLAGRLNSKLPESKNVHYLGNIAYQDVIYFLNSLDVAVICLRDSLFCRYCFPQKLYEILACETPVVAANIGVLKSVLVDYPELLFDSEIDLSEKLIMQTKKKIKPDIKVNTWEEQAKLFEKVLSKTLGGLTE